MVGAEDLKIYPEIAKFVSYFGSVRLLDAISQDEIENIVYQESKRLMKEGF